jgi:hypothetical protein
MKNYSNLIADNDAEDRDNDDGEDLTDAISRLGMDDDSAFGTATVAFRSVAPGRRTSDKNEEEHHDKTTSIHGNTALGLPYMLELWRDSFGKSRVSIQVQLLSGRNAYKQTFARVSTNGKCLVLTMPMSPYLARSDYAFNTFLLKADGLSEMDKKHLLIRLKHHPKCAGRMVATSKVKGRSNTQGFFYEQRIPLPRKVKHEYATAMDGDDLFHGKTFVEYPDGSQFMHVELVSEVKDSYCPEERMLEPAMMRTAVAAAAGANAAGMSSGMSVDGDDYYFDSTRVLFAAEDNHERKISAKRGRGDADHGDATSTVGTRMTIGGTRITTTTHHDQVRQQATAVLHRAEHAPVRTIGGGLKQAPNAAPNQHQQPASSLQRAVNHNQASEQTTNG